MIRRVAWVAATSIGLVLGGFVLHFPGSFGDLRSWDPAALIFGGILGFITGVWVGVFQWVALLLPRRRGGRLLLAMGIGIGITHALNDAAPSSLGLPIVAIASGLGTTAAVAVILGERRPVALVACFVGWAGGLLLAVQVTSTLGLPASETPVGWATEHAVAGLVVGLAWGTLTVITGLPELLRRPGETAPSDPGPGHPA
jgi:hypothetical protein